MFVCFLLFTKISETEQIDGNCISTHAGKHFGKHICTLQFFQADIYQTLFIAITACFSSHGLLAQTLLQIYQLLLC